MSNYSRLPGIDEENNFNPPVRYALANSPEVNTAIVKALATDTIVEAAAVEAMSDSAVQAALSFQKERVISGSMNTLTDPGIYPIGSLDVTNRPPIEAYGSCQVVQSSTNTVIQEYTTIQAKPQRYIRRGTVGSTSITWLDWSRYDIFSVPGVSSTPLSSDDNVDTLLPGTYIVSNVVIARDLGLPWEYPCIIDVRSISSGSAVSYTATTAEQPPRQFLKSRLNDGTLSSWAEISIKSDMPSSEGSAGPVRRSFLQQALTARKGGIIGTSGRGVIALRFDDAPDEFVSKVLPLLIERGLPFTRVTTSDTIHDTPLPLTVFSEMENYTIESGGEVWNHGRTHKNVGGDSEIYDEFIGALEKLRTEMPRIPIDCFAPPGGSVSYDGHMPSTEVSNWSDTYAGRILAGNHAIASGYFENSYYRPLDGLLRDGQIHYSNDSRSVSATKQLVDRARDWGVGVVNMWHPNNFDTSGYMTTSDFEEVLDYIVSERDAGNILVLTKSGLGVADIRSDFRDDILSTHQGSSISESITYPQYRQNVIGSTRELVANVSGSSGQTVTSKIGTSSKTHTIPASGSMKIRHVATIPLDSTSLTVSIDAETSNARLMAV